MHAIVVVGAFMDKWYPAIQAFTEALLTRSKRRRLLKQERQKLKNPIVDWLEAFLWAAGVVLVINQYLFQAYQIPSESMMNTLQVSDRIFVNKFVYGPELLPGIGKLPGVRVPARDNVIVFENPLYLSRGPIFDLTQRILYMLTLSIVDIDRDQYGNPRAHFLIKRAVGVAGDRIRIVEGEVQLMPAGLDRWLSEPAFKQLSGATYQTRRLIGPQDYTVIHAQALADAYKSAGLTVDQSVARTAQGEVNAYGDEYERVGTRYEALHAIYPEQRDAADNWQQFKLGWYIPAGWVFPMGDNRDNSKDARYFGPVRVRNVLGKAMFIYWPIDRIGAIN